MFELIKIIIDIIKGGTELTKHVDKQKKSRIGLEFFNIYLYLNQIRLAGYEVVNALEEHANSLDFFAENGFFPHISSVRPKLMEQKINLERFLNSSGNMISELNILDDAFVFDVIPSMSIKKNNVDRLLDILERGSMPIPDSKERELVETYHGKNVYERCDFGQPFSELNLDMSDDDYESLEKRITSCALIKKYLQNNNPRDILIDVENTLKSYRDTIEKTFSISDILVQVKTTDEINEEHKEIIGHMLKAQHARIERAMLEKKT